MSCDRLYVVVRLWGSGGNGAVSNCDPDAVNELEETIFRRQNLDRREALRPMTEDCPLPTELNLVKWRCEKQHLFVSPNVRVYKISMHLMPIAMRIQ